MSTGLQGFPFGSLQQFALFFLSISTRAWRSITGRGRTRQRAASRNGDGGGVNAFVMKRKPQASTKRPQAGMK